MARTRLSKCVAAARTPRAWPYLRTGIMPTFEHDALLGRRQYRTVIDVGAHRGQFAAYSRLRFPDACIHAFEPLHGPRHKLAEVIESLPAS